MTGGTSATTLMPSGRTLDYRSDVGFNRRTNTNLHDLFLRFNTEPESESAAGLVALL